MASKRTSKKVPTKIPHKTAQRIVAISLQNPDYGARRLVPLLKKKRISVSATTIYSILRRNGLQTRNRRLAKLGERSKKARRPKAPPKKPAAKITDDVAERISEISLQNPDFGAQRLAPLLNKAGIMVSSSSIYSILKRRGLQTREKRLAKAEEASTAPVLFPKKFPEKIPPEVEERVIDLSLQNPDFGARRLIPLLKLEEITVSAAAVYTILRRHGLETREKRFLTLEEGPALDVPPVPVIEATELGAEPAVMTPIPSVFDAPPPAEAPQRVPEPVVVAPIPAETPPLRKAPIKPIRKRGHWVFYLLYLLLIALIGYLGFYTVQTVQYARVESEAVAAADPVRASTAAQTDTSHRPLSDYQIIWERNLFNIIKKNDSESEKKISLGKLALAKKDLGLELVGTVVADDPKMSRAIIDNRKTREQEAYREGDKAGAVRIKKILRNNVVITTAKGDELLTVEIKETSKRSTSSPPARQVGSSSSALQQSSSTPRPSVRTSSIKLARDEVEASLADIAELMQQVRLTPYMQGDQPSGFRISNIPANSVLRKMGLRSRDVIVGVDEESISSPDQAPDFFQKLADGGEVTIKVKRRRRTRQIKLNIE
jgi:general secretion pathway protein C